ncbi:MAG: hypothetical protein GY727_09950 [Gammaproteobacteria bacterium]|nr:hypothetical protein [Gammaproteobacteria bacterium]MCP4090779.1 hypothetical protein [Gammaproteobacteria bacterium]MCP4832828.1 hypothetical protein [Gammaproteobacteria bacterium]MCP4927984.1 hypothetical protein [Gammaproteobacteria bacterium]
MKKSFLVNVFTALALCFLAVIYGAASVHLGWWPSSIIADAKNAAAALLSVQEEELRRNWPTSMEQIEESDYQSLAVINYAPALERDDDLIFVDGGTHQLRAHCPDNGCIAWVMDKAGTIRHVWDIGSELIWENASHIKGFSRAENIYSVGAHPFPNGDLLVVYQGRNTYPYGVGIAKFDKDSNLLWLKGNYAHHWLSVDQDGYIYVSAFNALQAPVQLGASNLKINCNSGVLQEDVILVLDADGNEVERISILQALADSGYLGVVFQGVHSDLPLPLNYSECDPTHLNDVRVISMEDAATSPYLSAGDLLVSLRSNNTVMVISRETKKVTWVSVGRTALQHSPRYMGDNTLLVFDNLGGKADEGGSRLLRLDMDTDAVDVIYPPQSSNQSVSEAKNYDVLSATGGQISLSDDRSRALISLTRQGRTLEIDLASGKLLWEFLNIHDVSGIVEGDQGSAEVYGRFATQTVTYFNEADFPFNEGRLH